MKEDIRYSFLHWTAIGFDVSTKQHYCLMHFDNEIAAKNVIEYLQTWDEVRLAIIEKDNDETDYILFSKNIDKKEYKCFSTKGKITEPVKAFIRKHNPDLPFSLVALIDCSNILIALSPMPDYTVPVHHYFYNNWDEMRAYYAQLN